MSNVCHSEEYDDGVLSIYGMPVGFLCLFVFIISFGSQKWFDEMFLSATQNEMLPDATAMGYAICFLSSK